MLGDRQIALCRELTKKYETVLRMRISQVLEYYENNPLRGECVIVIEGSSPQELEKEKQQSWESMPLEQHMEIYTSQGISRKEAMKLVAKDRGVGKRVIYQQLLQDERQPDCNNQEDIP